MGGTQIVVMVCKATMHKRCPRVRVVAVEHGHRQRLVGTPEVDRGTIREGGHGAGCGAGNRKLRVCRGNGNIANGHRRAGAGDLIPLRHPSVVCDCRTVSRRSQFSGDTICIAEDAAAIVKLTLSLTMQRWKHKSRS